MADDESLQPFLEKDSSLRQPQSHGISKVLIILCITQFLSLLLIPVAYFTGFHKASSQHPRLSTNIITKDATRWHLQKLDDGLETKQSRTLKYKGVPRPELDEAWNDLYRHMNVRVHADEAKKANFSSVILDDGSEDSYGAPVVFHNLHCLKTIRQTFFPKAYPEAWELYKPPGEGQINAHVDHCLDNLRQAIMCQGDMSMYRYEWLHGKENPYPQAGMDHVCVNWDRLQAWAATRYFDVEKVNFLAGRTL